MSKDNGKLVSELVFNKVFNIGWNKRVILECIFKVDFPIDNGLFGNLKAKNSSKAVNRVVDIIGG